MDDMYGHLAKKPEEGFDKIAYLFERYRKSKRNTKPDILRFFKNGEGGVFRSDIVIWQCANCGHIHVGKMPPRNVPCASPQGLFPILAKIIDRPKKAACPAGFFIFRNFQNHPGFSCNFTDMVHTEKTKVAKRCSTSVFQRPKSARKTAISPPCPDCRGSARAKFLRKIFTKSPVFG
jgi:hypothetical protein